MLNSALRIPSRPLNWTSRALRSLAAIGVLAASLAISRAQTAATPLTITTIAGQTGTLGSSNGTGTAARFSAPAGLVINSAGDLIVADTTNNVFRRVTPAGVVTTYAGNPADNEDRPINAGSADGPFANASFRIGDSVPEAYTIIGSYTMAINGAGDIFFADTLNNTVRKLGANGVVSTIAGAAPQQGTDNGTGSAARFLIPSGVALDGSGNLYVTDSGNNTIRKITTDAVVSTFAGVPRTGGSADGSGSAARFNNPAGIVSDSAGNLYVTDYGNHTIRKITPAGAVTTLAGLAGSAGTADGSGNLARFRNPTAIAIDSAGNLYVADSGNHSIRRVSPTGAVSTIAGGRGVAGTADGTGNAVRFNEPSGIAVDGSGTVYVADTINHTIRRGVPASNPPTLQIQSQPQRQLVGSGSSATFKVVATGSPSPSYQWFKDGVAIGGATGSQYTIASTTGNDAGFYSVVVTSGSISFTSTDAELRVFPPGTQIPPIVVLAYTTDQTVSVGQSANFSVEVTGVAAPTYQWRKNDIPITGATNATFTIGSAQSSDAGSYSVTITDGENILTTAPSTLTVTAGSSTSAPAIGAHPASQTVAAGATVTLSVSASGNPAPTYQWRRNGVAFGNGATSSGAIVSGASTSTVTITGVGPADAGSYTVLVSNTAGSATSNAATLTVNAGASSRIVNLSIRSTAGTGSQTLIAGFVIAGGNKPLLVRGVGPTLANFGVTGALAAPQLSVFSGNSPIAANAGWQTATNAAQVAETAARLQAFALPNGSLDSAILATIPEGTYTAQITGAGNTTGIALAEVYDADTTTAARLINVSARTQVNAGDAILIAGFVIVGEGQKRVLIRGIGPTLANFGVTGVLANPRLTLFSGNTQVATNTGWTTATNSADIAAAANQVSAFPLGSTAADSAILISLQPGSYSAQVSGVNNSTGVGLVELYEVP